MEKEVKSYMLRVRMTKDDKTKLETIAQEQHTTPSAWMRGCIYDYESKKNDEQRNTELTNNFTLRLDDSEVAKIKALCEMLSTSPQKLLESYVMSQVNEMYKIMPKEAPVATNEGDLDGQVSIFDLDPELKAKIGKKE